MVRAMPSFSPSYLVRVHNKKERKKTNASTYWFPNRLSFETGPSPAGDCTAHTIYLQTARVTSHRQERNCQSSVGELSRD